MGGDHGPPVVVGGIKDYLRRHGGEVVRFLLHGDEAAIQRELTRAHIPEGVCEIRHTDKTIASDEKPATAMRRGKGSSLWNAIEAVKTGEAGSVVSGGNTGALMAISKLILRMSAPGLERPAIVASWPTLRGVTAVLDVGANVESDAEQLIEFAIMGEAFHAAVHGVARPTVGILNVGSEDMKGHEEVREASRILRDGGLGLNYHGFVEGDDIGKGTVDVVVTEGFVGNIALKTAEGTARQVGSYLRSALKANLMSRIGALFASSALNALRRKMDPRTVNGGVFMGLNGIVIKSHGGTDEIGYKSALGLSYEMARSRLMDKIGDTMHRFPITRAETSLPPDSEAKSA